MSGYKNAADKALEILNSVAVPISLDDRNSLRKAALTSARSKMVEGVREHLADISVEAVDLVREKIGDAFIIDVDNTLFLLQRFQCELRRQRRIESHFRTSQTLSRQA